MFHVGVLRVSLTSIAQLQDDGRLGIAGSLEGGNDCGRRCDVDGGDGCETPS